MKEKLSKEEQLELISRAEKEITLYAAAFKESIEAEKDCAIAVDAYNSIAEILMTSTSAKDIAKAITMMRKCYHTCEAAIVRADDAAKSCLIMEKKVDDTMKLFRKHIHGNTTVYKKLNMLFDEAKLEKNKKISEQEISIPNELLLEYIRKLMHLTICIGVKKADSKPKLKKMFNADDKSYINEVINFCSAKQLSYFTNEYNSVLSSFRQEGRKYKKI